MADNYSYNTIPLPEERDLNLKQKRLLESYIALYEKIEQSPYNRVFAQEALSHLGHFYNQFPDHLKEKYKIWYRYQVNLVDPVLGATVKMTQLINSSGLKENLNVDPTGKSFRVPFYENEPATLAFLKLLANELPSLQYQTVRVA